MKLCRKKKQTRVQKSSERIAWRQSNNTRNKTILKKQLKKRIVCIIRKRTTNSSHGINHPSWHLVDISGSSTWEPLRDENRRIEVLLTQSVIEILVRHSAISSNVSEIAITSSQQSRVADDYRVTKDVTFERFANLFNIVCPASTKQASESSYCCIATDITRADAFPLQV